MGTRQGRWIRHGEVLSIGSQLESLRPWAVGQPRDQQADVPSAPSAGEGRFNHRCPGLGAIAASHRNLPVDSTGTARRRGLRSRRLTPDPSFVNLPDPTDHQPIQGPRLRFRPMTADDVPNMLRWLADPDVMAFYGRPPASEAEAATTSNRMTPRAGASSSRRPAVQSGRSSIPTRPPATRGPPGSTFSSANQMRATGVSAPRPSARCCSSFLKHDACTA